MEEKGIEEKKGLSNKAKGIIAGSTAAGIAAIVGVVSVVSLTGNGSQNQNENTTYSVSISSEFEGFEDTNLTINKGTKIKDLKTMITAPVAGYRVEGFYRDVLCTDEFDEEEIITENTKIYINFEILTFTVRSYESTTSTEPLETLTVEWNKEAQFKTPTKSPDKLAKEYEFAGWVDIRNNPVNLSDITEDLDVYATFRVKEYNYYKVAEIPSQVTITKGSGEQIEDVTTNTSLKCGERIKITYAVTEGYKKTEFSIIGASKVEGTEDWYEVTGEGEIKVTYAEEKLAFVVGNLQNGVKLTDAEGNEVSGFLYGDIITVTITPSIGYHVTDIDTEGLFPIDGLVDGKHQYAVRGDVSVSFEEEINTVTVKYYDYDGSLLGSEVVSHGGSITTANPTRAIDERIGHYEFTGWANKLENGNLLDLTNMQVLEHDGVIEAYATYELNYVEYNLIIPSRVTVTNENGKILSSTDTVHFGDELTVSYTLSDHYHLGLFRINGMYYANNSKYVVERDVEILFSQIQNEYSISIPSNVTVMKNGVKLTSASTVHYGDTITISYTETTGFRMTSFMVNGSSHTNGASYVVKGNTTITYTETRRTYIIDIDNDDRIIIQLENGDEISSGGSVNYGDTILIRIRADKGYHITGVYVNGVKISDGESGRYVVTGEVSISYTQEKNEATVNFYQDNKTSLIETQTNVKHGTSLSIATPSKTDGDPDYTYTFTGWVDANGNAVDITNLQVLSHNSTINLYASYAESYEYSYLDFEEYNDGYMVAALNDDNVTDVTIPATYNNKKVYGIKDGKSSDAFYSKKNLQSVTISEGINYIGGYAFAFCTNLISVTIPATVTSIGTHAFTSCSNLSSIIIPEGVLDIGDNAFRGCSSLSSITISNSVTSIGDSAFYNCTSLSSITIPNSVTSIGDYAFYYCIRLSSITISNSVTSIGDSTFYNCIHLSSITIPNSVTSIGDSAFRECKNLTSITIPNSITSITGNAFTGCNLEYNSYENGSYLGNSDNPYLVLIKFDDKSASNIFINTKTKIIGDSAFKYCSNLTSITIPNSVTSIGGTAFSNCTSLTSITIPDSVTSIGNHAFSDCSSLSSITIPDSVTSIGNYAFYYCTSLTSITIPDGVTSIGNYAFYYCSKLTSITMGNGVTSIGNCAFSDCSSLSSITIPDSVTSIGDSAFRNCRNLSSITIPDSVTSIGRSAFQNCTNLTSVIFEDPEGWFVASSSTETSGTDVVLKYPAQNATCLKTTYSSSYWKKK